MLREIIFEMFGLIFSILGMLFSAVGIIVTLVLSKKVQDVLDISVKDETLMINSIKNLKCHYDEKDEQIDICQK